MVRSEAEPREAPGDARRQRGGTAIALQGARRHHAAGPLTVRTVGFACSAKEGDMGCAEAGMQPRYSSAW